MAEPVLLPVPQEQFLADLRQLAEAVRADDWRPGYLVGIGRGGLVPAVYLSHALDLPMLSVDRSSGVPEFDDELLGRLAARTAAGERLLIVDDINDSGMTIIGLDEAFARHGAVAENIRVAVLIDNVRSRARVRYSARSIDRAEDKSWFVFPWEQVAPREELVAEALAVPERLG